MGSEDGSIRIWMQRRATATPLQAFQRVWSVGCSPDGKRIVSSQATRAYGSGMQRRANASTRCEPSGWVHSVTQPGRGKRIVSGSEDGAYGSGMKTGECKHTLKGHSDSVMSVGYSPDGKRIVSGHGTRAYGSEDGRMQHVLHGHSDRLVGGLQPGREADRLRVRRLEHTDLGCKDGRRQAHAEGHSDSVMSVGYSPDGKRIVSGSWDKSIRIWDAETDGAHVGSLKGVIYSMNDFFISS